MVEIASYAEKEPGRFRRGGGWKINMFGKNSDVPKPDLQAFRLDLNAHQKLDSHFHIVDQFQVFIAGSGAFGRDAVPVITAHYADHHTGYGPIVAGPQGLSYLTLRPKTDAGMVKLSNPDVRSLLKESKRRHRMSAPVVPSIEPVLRNRIEVSVETVMEEKPGDDGMCVKVIRLGPSMSVEAPTAAGSGGQYMIVMNGQMLHQGEAYRPWSLIFVSPDDPAPLLHAGEEGLEVMITQFPAGDGWMQTI